MEPGPDDNILWKTLDTSDTSDTKSTSQKGEGDDSTTKKVQEISAGFKKQSQAFCAPKLNEEHKEAYKTKGFKGVIGRTIHDTSCMLHNYLFITVALFPVVIILMCIKNILSDKNFFENTTQKMIEESMVKPHSANEESQDPPNSPKCK